MYTKQNSQELMAVYEELKSSITPAVLLDSDETSSTDVKAKVEASATLLKSYMIKHFTDSNGVTDFSFGNMRAAVVALKNQLAWAVAPKKHQNNVVPVSETRAIEQANRDRQEAGNKVLDAAMVEEAKSILVETQAKIENHTTYPHSRTYRERDLLRAEYNKRVARLSESPSVQQALEVHDAIQALQRRFPD